MIEARPGDDTSAILIENFRDYASDQTGFCRGDLGKIDRVFNRFDIVDRRAFVPLSKRHQPTFLGLKGSREGFRDLKTEQVRTLEEWIASGYGQLHAPPRWGKNVWLAALICVLKQRTLVLAHTIDLLAQAYEEFCDWTDINDLERFNQTKLAGLFDDALDDIYPVVTFSTWQAFYTAKKAGQRLRRWKNSWGLVWVDESHLVKAPCYTVVVNTTNSWYRGGMTGTPILTKSKLHVITNDVLGPVTAIGREQQLPVHMIFAKTPHILKRFDSWTIMVTRLTQDDRRNEFIVDRVMEDVADGRVVLVTTDRVKHCYVLRDEILSRDQYLRVEVVEGRTPGHERKRIRLDSRKGKVDVTVAMNRVIQFGYNVPIMSSLHNTIPLTDPENWEQRVRRVSTVLRKEDKKKLPKQMREKPEPLCYVYYDFGESNSATYAYLNTVKKKSEELGFRIDSYTDFKKKKKHAAKN